MNPSFYKSVSMRKNAWDTVTSLSEKILPYGKISRSQVVEIAINRLNHQVCRGDVSLNIFSKPKKLHIVKVKLPEPAYVGAAITDAEIEKRNITIYAHRVVAQNKLTLQQLGTMYNLSRERVRQIQDEVSTEKLKQTNKEKHAS